MTSQGQPHVPHLEFALGLGQTLWSRKRDLPLKQIDNVTPSFVGIFNAPAALNIFRNQVEKYYPADPHW